MSRSRAFLGALMLCGLGLGACAVVEAPPGGPLDTVPPTLISFSPDSASVGLGPVDHLTFLFSEKMDRVPADGWLHLYPARKFRKTSWHGSTRADVWLQEPLPPDTVVVVELAAGMKDAHKVSGFLDRRFPVATGDSIPDGRICGSLVMADSALAGGMVELYAVPDDSVPLAQQPLLRRTRCDDLGRFCLNWLPVPSGPYLMRAFADLDKNSRPGEKESKRYFPDTLSISRQQDHLALDPLVLFPLDTPGDLRLIPRSVMPPAGRFVAFAQVIADADTGWQPVPMPYDSTKFTFLDSALADTLHGILPGSNRLILFADLDRDSSLSIVPDSLLGDRTDSLLYVVSDSLGDTTGFSLEPWLGIEPVVVEPGLFQTRDLPAEPFELVPWAAPPAEPVKTEPDSLDTDQAMTPGAASGDTLQVKAAAVDSAGQQSAVPDSLDNTEPNHD